MDHIESVCSSERLKRPEYREFHGRVCVVTRQTSEQSLEGTLGRVPEAAVTIPLDLIRVFWDSVRLRTSSR